MNSLDNFILDFKSKSRHHNKLINFVYPELAKITKSNILEFGVSQKGMSTQLFLEYSKINECNLYSIDLIDYSKKFENHNWNFIQSRDDNISYIRENIPEKFKLIFLDTIHEAKHVKNIIYLYYDLLDVNSCFFIDDISWLPYTSNSEKNNFYCEINNLETFEILLDIYNNNQINFNIEFNFEGTGMCKLTKLNSKKLNQPKTVTLRKYTIKNFIRKILKKK